MNKLTEGEDEKIIPFVKALWVFVISAGLVIRGAGGGTADSIAKKTRTYSPAMTSYYVLNMILSYVERYDRAHDTLPPPRVPSTTWLLNFLSAWRAADGDGLVRVDRGGEGGCSDG